MEHRYDLWWLAAPAGLWIGHFLTTYALVAVGCAKPWDGPLGLVFAVLTAVALSALLGIGVRSFRRYAAVPADAPEADSDIARHRFLALATLLLAGLATIGIGFVAVSFAVVGECR